MQFHMCSACSVCVDFCLHNTALASTGKSTSLHCERKSIKQLSFQGIPECTEEAALAIGDLEAQTLVFRHLPWERLHNASAEQQQASLTSIARYAEALCKKPQKDYTHWLEAAEACLKVALPTCVCSEDNQIIKNEV